MKIYKDKKIEGVEIIDSETLGSTVTIMGGIHGNEPCGLEVLKYIKNNINLISGKIILIKGNPRAIEKNQRQTGTNINRIFRDEKTISKEIKQTYEYKRSREIMKFLDKSDILLDLHSSSIKNTVPFTICSPQSNKLTKYFPILFSCNGFDEMEPGGVDYYMNQQNKNGICIECGYHNDKSTTKLGIECIEIILKKLKMINSTEKQFLKEKQTKILKAKLLYKTKTDKFLLTKKMNNFEKIRRGQIIGIDGNKKVISEIDGRILFAHNCNKINDEAFILLEN